MSTPWDLRFFAKLERRLVRLSNCVSLVTIIESYCGRHSKVDVVLYRLNRREVGSGVQERFEMVRFLPEDESLAFRFFPHGPPFLNSGSAWRETTGWLSHVVSSDRPIWELDLVRVEEYPKKTLPAHFRLREYHNSSVFR